GIAVQAPDRGGVEPAMADLRERAGVRAGTGLEDEMADGGGIAAGRDRGVTDSDVNIAAIPGDAAHGGINGIGLVSAMADHDEGALARARMSAEAMLGDRRTARALDRGAAEDVDRDAAVIGSAVIASRHRGGEGAAVTAPSGAARSFDRSAPAPARPPPSIRC